MQIFMRMNLHMLSDSFIESLNETGFDMGTFTERQLDGPSGTYRRSSEYKYYDKEQTKMNI